MKENTMVRIDYDLKQKAIKNNICLSTTLEDAIQIKLGIITGSLNEIDLQILNKDIEKEQEIIQKSSQNLQNLIQKREKMAEIIEKNTQNELQKQKESMEKMIRCLNCGTLTHETEKRHTMKSGILCNSCFQTIEPRKIKEWI